MKSLQMIALFWTLFLNISFSQVNTEAMRDDDQMPGFHNQLSLSFSYISGNYTFMMLYGDYRLDYHSKSNWHGFFVINYDRAFEKSHDDFSNRGFGHIRAVNHWKPKIYFESFIQKEFDYFIDLENRELFGGGFRLNPFDQFFIGIGAMNEVETYQYSSKEHVNLKSTNYVNYSSELNELVTIQNVLYYQFKSNNIAHYRILWDSKLIVQGAGKKFDWISFHINLKYRYDMSDLNPKGNSYFEISNGLGLSF